MSERVPVRVERARGEHVVADRNRGARLHVTIPLVPAQFGALGLTANVICALLVATPFTETTVSEICAVAGEI